MDCTSLWQVAGNAGDEASREDLIFFELSRLSSMTTAQSSRFYLLGTNAWSDLHLLLLSVFHVFHCKVSLTVHGVEKDLLKPLQGCQRDMDTKRHHEPSSDVQMLQHLLANWRTSGSAMIDHVASIICLLVRLTSILCHTCPSALFKNFPRIRSQGRSLPRYPDPP